MILVFFPNSMIFPGLENAFLIFHDFPGRWEPWDGSMTLSGCSLPSTGAYEGSLLPTRRQRDVCAAWVVSARTGIASVNPALSSVYYPPIR